MQSKRSSFHLNATVHTVFNPCFTQDIFIGFLSFFQKTFWYIKPLISFCFGAFFFIRTIGAVFTFVNGYFRFIATFTFLLFDKNREQCFPGMTSVCVSFFIISHIFTFADILFETPLLPFFISLWLYVWFLLDTSQIRICFFAFISGISWFLLYTYEFN